MLKFFGFLFLVALAVGAWGWHKEWFTPSSTTENGKTTYGLQVDREKMSKDVADYKDAISKKIAELKNKSKDAKGDAEKAIAEKKKIVEQRLKEFEDAAADQREAAKKKLDEAVAEFDAAVKSAAGH